MEAATHQHEAPGPKLGFEKDTIGVTQPQILGPELEPGTRPTDNTHL